MVWFMQTLEIADANGRGIGKFRRTAWSDEDGGGPFGLCDHEHATRQEAYDCPEAAARAEMY